MTDGADESRPDADDGDSEGYVHTPSAVDNSGADDGRGYVHTPEGVEQKEPGTNDVDTADGAATAHSGQGATVNSDGVIHPDAVEREFDWRGWLLVGILFVAFVVAPVTIYLVPPGEHYFTVLIVMPLVPALLLAVVAVWATTRP